MKIKSVKAYPVQAKMAIPYITAMARKVNSDSVVTIVETDHGAVGFGQAATSAQNYSRFEEHQDTIVHVVNRYISEALLGMNPFDIELIHKKMGEVAKGHLYAHSTVDLACYDLMGKVTQHPVVRLLGGALRDRIPLCAPHLSILPPEELARQAAHFVGVGYKFINLRVGLDLARDCQNISAVREAIGSTIPIAVDFSQSLGTLTSRSETAIFHIRKLEQAGASSFEQPVDDWDIEGLSRISHAIDSPVVADESVRTVHDAIRIIERRAADVVKIKLMKVGGIFPARKIATILNAVGIPVTVGNGLAGGIANSAEAHFAFSIPNLKVPGEMNGFLRLENDPTSGDLVTQDCDLLCPTQAGIGASADMFLDS
jgi:L-Ala-D/L-Glu epimerase